MSQARRNPPKFPGLKPGHWTWNPYNWNAVGSLVRRMPWDCRGVEVKEAIQDPDLRILAHTKPNGKPTVVLASRSFREHTFRLGGLPGKSSFKGYRYTPDHAGQNVMGAEIGLMKSAGLSPKVPDMSWEFWEEE